MTQPKPSPKESTKEESIPGFISMIIVVAILGLIGLFLTNRPAETTKIAEQPTSIAAVIAPTVVVTTSAVALTTPAVAATAPAVATIAPVAAEAKKYSQLPPMTIDPAKSYMATLTTPRGDIVIKLRPDLAPQTVNSFVFLAREGFYNGLTWHRVIADFMAQGGDPTGTGMGGPGYSVPAEFTDKVLFDRPGLVAMARASDPNSAGSQFFITTAPAPNLDRQYTIFGEVMSGQELVKGIPLRDPQMDPNPGEQMLKITIAE